MDENEHGGRTGDGGAAGTDAIVHGSAVAVAGRGVLILGPSGAGKSTLALRLLALGGELVADDRVMLRRAGGSVAASAPASLAGLIEARGVGILRLPYRQRAGIDLAVDLAQAPEGRMPPKRKTALLGAQVDLIVGQGVPHLDAIVTVLMHRGGWLD